MLFRTSTFILLVGAVLINGWKPDFGKDPNVSSTTSEVPTTEEAYASGPTLDASVLNAKIKGKYLKTRLDREIYGYKGLQYADQPERFQVSEASGPYRKETMLDGQKDGNVCPQRNPRFVNKFIAMGNEDCLNLNVYTPVEKPNSEDLLPVMVYFYGGNFISGDASDYQPTYLLDEDVVLVVPNFRLGALSFFTNGEETAVGNLALYDQMAALEWVKSFISDFGGDPDRVTIFGQGSGAVSVNYHVLSDVSQDFTGAIAHSGSALDLMALDESPLTTSLMLASVVPECAELTETIGPSTNADVLQCMFNDASMNSLAVAYDLLLDALRYQESPYEHGGPYPFAAPSVQTFDSLKIPMIVSQPPIEASGNARVSRVPLMIGNVAQEGSVPFGEMFSRYYGPSGKSNDENYVKFDMVPEILDFIGISDPTRTYSKSLTSEYLSYTEADDFLSYCPGMTDMVGSLVFKSGAMETARQQSSLPNRAREDVYMYSFDYEGNTTLFDDHFTGEEFPPVCPSGVSSSDDLLYLFDLSNKQTEEDMKMVQKMVTLWTLFAKYRDPTPADEESWKALDIPLWEDFTPYTPSFMSISSNPELKEDFSSSWTITGDVEKEVTTEVPHITAEPYDIDAILEEYQDLQDERDAYLITMIIFIVLFLAAVGAAIFFFMQARR